MTHQSPVPFAALLMAALAAAGTAAAADPAHELVYAAYQRSVNKGDVQAAALLFAPEGVIRGSRFCPPDSPCRGTEELRERFFKPMAQLGLRLSPTDATSQGDTLTVRMEARNRVISGTGVERAIVVDRLVVRGGRIESLDIDFDRQDPETARFLAAAMAAPRN